MHLASWLAETLCASGRPGSRQMTAARRPRLLPAPPRTRTTGWRRTQRARRLPPAPAADPATGAPCRLRCRSGGRCPASCSQSRRNLRCTGSYIWRSSPHLVSKVCAQCPGGVMSLIMQQGSMPESSPPDSAQADGLATAASAESDMASAQTADVGSAGRSVTEAAAAPSASAGAAASLTASSAVSSATVSTDFSGSGAGFWQRPQPTASGQPSDTPASTATASAVTGSSEADVSTQPAATAADDTAATAEGSESKRPQQVLYIQMEFCPRTLRQVTDPCL